MTMMKMTMMIEITTTKTAFGAPITNTTYRETAVFLLYLIFTSIGVFSCDGDKIVTVLVVTPQC